MKSFCRDGTAIESIEISTAAASLPAGVVLMDTPGIDSTDAAHRLATEEAIHLADLIFYVMDYNHVQSEESFLFTKSLTEAGKRVALVINQIDKHREEELSFASFVAGVKDAFAAWGVTPEAVFFTSMKDEAHAQGRGEGACRRPPRARTSVRRRARRALGGQPRLGTGGAESA